ncbi:epoxide hydrolase 1-like [Armigeres subalbatus]|uniref:epoxide hydrolase 1-like n=1 Tax=Armigeres subalbatus TaxID=124917 RepID=UPI002ED33692
MASLKLTLMSLAIWTLSLFYSVQVLFFVAVQFFRKPHSKLWVVKKRPYPPQCLQKHDCGVDKLITVNGVKLHYVENGDPSKPLMVFVHGFPEFWFSWRYQLKEFAKDYWVVAVDMRGYGDSDKPQELDAYQVPVMVQDIKELVTALGRKKFTLVAHDWGAVVAWDFLSQHMDMLEKYIFMDAPSRRVAHKLITSTKEQFKMSWYMFFFQMPKLPELFVRMNDLKMLDIALGKFCSPEELEAYKYTFSKKGALTPPINYYRANLSPNAKRNIRPPTDIPHVPGLYLLGEKDLFISKASAPLLQEQFNNLEYKIVPGGGHFVQQDKPELVNQIMREFLAKK